MAKKTQEYAPLVSREAARARMATKGRKTTSRPSGKRLDPPPVSMGEGGMVVVL